MARIIPGMFDKTQTSDPYNLQVTQDWIEKAIAGTLTGTHKINTASLTEALDLEGNVVLGDASTDTLVVNATSTFNAPIAQNISSAVTTATDIRSMVITQTMTAASTVNQIEVLKVALIADVQTGGWASAIFAQLDYVTDGGAYGSGSAFCGELSLPGSLITQGIYSVLQAEIDCPAGCNMSGRPISVIQINSWGDNKTQFDDVGFLFSIDGATSGATKFWYDHTDGAYDEWIKVRTPAGIRYIPLMDDQAA